jgi:hypothetical protein
VSDITIEFTGPQLALVFLLVGWPGAVLGAAAGALLWRRHSVIGAVAGAVVGLAVWVGVKILFR